MIGHAMSKTEMSLPAPADWTELRLGRLIINNAITVNGAFEAPVPEPNGWLVLDPDSQQASLEMWQAADAMVLGRKTYEGLAAVWPQMADLPGLEAYAEQMNSMPKYVASRTLSGPLEWNATLLEGDLADSMSSLKHKHDGNLIVSGAGELARDLLSHGLVDEVWFTVSPYLWSTGPRIFDDVGAVRLELVHSTTFPSGVVRLCYRPTPADPASTTASGS
jgi:dihydrofolate reductase